MKAMDKDGAGHLDGLLSTKLSSSVYLYLWWSGRGCSYTLRSNIVSGTVNSTGCRKERTQAHEREISVRFTDSFRRYGKNMLLYQDIPQSNSSSFPIMSGGTPGGC